MATAHAILTSPASLAFPNVSADANPLPDALAQVAALGRAGRFGESLDLLRASLNQARAEAESPDQWRAQIHRHVRPHPILAVSHENPFVDRCFSKPRGYAGDAVMLDFIYRHAANQTMLERVTPRGRALLECSLTTPAPRAVRNRCRLLADEIDAVCSRNQCAEILSIACGHLREAEHSVALNTGAFGRFVALDQDEASIATVTHDHGRLGIQATPGSVKTVIARGERELGRFDFIYAAGLYDYLNHRIGARLMAAMFALLKPGGKLWIANFAPNIADVGFMEAIMDWWLIFRDAGQMLAMAEDGLPEGDTASVRTFAETEQNVIFLEAVRA